MGKAIGSIVLFIVGAASLVMTLNFLALASFRNDVSGYLLVGLFFAIAILCLYFAMKVGNYRNLWPLALSVCVAGLLLVWTAAKSILFNGDKLPWLLHYEKVMLSSGIILCLIGIFAFLKKRNT